MKRKLAPRSDTNLLSALFGSSFDGGARVFFFFLGEEKGVGLETTRDGCVGRCTVRLSED